MINALSFLCHAMLATGGAAQRNTDEATKKCSWLPALIEHTNDPAVIAAGSKICKDLSETSVHKLTPMHLAVMLADVPLMNALHAIGQPIDTPDIIGFTPLHHMAMTGNRVGVEWLIARGANPDHRNKMGGTYSDYLRFIQPTVNASLTLDHSRFSAHTNDHVVIDPRCQSPKVTYVDENVVRSRDLHVMWKKVALEIAKGSFEQRIAPESELALYSAFKAKPPRLEIKPVTTDDTNTNLTIKALFCGVFALEPIAKGTPIAEYVGEMDGGELTEYRLLRRDKTYVWDDGWPTVDGKRYRSAGAMMNHAFPNAEMNGHYAARNYGVDGLPNRRVFTAIDPIAVGEQITIDYGAYTWHVDPVEMRPAAMRKFVKRNSWAKLYDQAVAFSKGLPADKGKLTQFLSILKSDKALVYLARLGLLTENDGFSYVKTVVETMELPIDLKAVKKVMAKRKQALAAQTAKTKTDL